MKCSFVRIAGFVGVVVSFLFPSAANALEGSVRIDGSSTVYPISAAVAEEFQREKENQKVRVTVAYSGTGGGFKKWCKGEMDINDASRKIKAEEIKCAKESRLDYVELPVAFDGLSVVVSTSNPFAKKLSMAELKKIWEPGSKIKKWSDLNPAWPAEPLKLYGAGHDSGTFDYFSEHVNGKSGVIRTESVVTSEDDNALVKGVAASPNAMAYFGFAYFAENASKLKALAIDGVTPSIQTIENGTYPLSRPVYIYVSAKAAQRPEVQAFVRYYLKNAREIVESVRYVPMPEAKYKEASATFEAFVKKVAPNAASPKS